MDAVKVHLLGALLDCPPETRNLLNRSAQCLRFDAGEVIFRQSSICRGLYVVNTGLFLRDAEWLNTQLILSPTHHGELVELAAALGDGRHNYTLSAQTSSLVFLLPMEVLQQAFQSYPPLRIQLLEELACKVLHAYHSCRLVNAVRSRDGMRDTLAWNDEGPAIRDGALARADAHA
jgi:CRP-like cAMP-binding protein